MSLKNTKNTSDAATETNNEAEQANHNVAQQTAKIMCDDDVEIQFKTDHEKAKQRKKPSKNKSNTKN